MKKVKCTLFLVLFFLISTLFSMSVDEILKKNYQARGGLEKIKAIQSFKIEGKMVSPGKKLELPIELTFKAPNKVKLVADAEGAKVVRLFDGTKCWLVGEDEAMEISANDAEELKNMVDAVFSLYNYQKNGFKAEYLGEEKCDDTLTSKIKLEKKGKKPITLYLDSKTGMEFKTLLRFKKEGETERVVEVFFRNYKKISDFMVPSFLEVKINGETFLITKFDKVDFNVKVADAVFKVTSKE